MSGEQLLDELKKRKVFSEEIAAKIRRELVLSGQPLEEIVAEGNLADENEFNQAKSEILKVPYQKIDLTNFDQKLLELIPEETVRTYKVAPLSLKDNLLIVGMVIPDDTKAQEALRFIARSKRLTLGIYLISYGDWQEIAKIYSPYKNEIASAVRSLNLKPGEGRRLVGLEEAMAGEEAPIIKIVSDTFKEAVRSRASDIHIEPQEKYLRIRLRVDGQLQEVASLPAELSQPVASRIKVISNLKIDETRIPQDGRFRAKIIGKEIDFRVATFPTPLGEKVAIRVLDPSTGLKNFNELGLGGKNLEIINSGLGKPFGMILVTGPTGSGKTTTLYALLRVLNKENVNIVSLEDPVEYFVSGVNQSQVKPEIGYDFASGLRQILRQDPDIIMVGEIRDNETAGLAIHSALTGHIVLSTLHTNNAVGVVPRLIDMKVDSFLLPSALNLMVSQRLVGLLCPNCKKPETASEPLQKIVEKDLVDLPTESTKDYKKPYQIYHSSGCSQCNNRGIVGRIGIFEVFQMSPALEEIINSGPTTQRILKEAKNQGMLTMRQDGVLKALSGLVSLEEVIRTTEEVMI